jgi:hypothetical protein
MGVLTIGEALDVGAGMTNMQVEQGSSIACTSRARVTA